MWIHTLCNILEFQARRKNVSLCHSLPAYNIVTHPMGNLEISCYKFVSCDLLVPGHVHQLAQVWTHLHQSSLHGKTTLRSGLCFRMLFFFFGLGTFKECIFEADQAYLETTHRIYSLLWNCGSAQFNLESMILRHE